MPLSRNTPSNTGPWNCPKGYGICWHCERPCDEHPITRAMHIYPNRPEHHEARAEDKKTRSP